MAADPKKLETMRSAACLACLLAALFVGKGIPALASPALLVLAQSSFQPYINARFGYRLDYPADFVPQGESDSGDGQVFIGEEGAELRVWGGFFKQRPPAPCKRSCSAAGKADAGLPLKLPVRIFSGSPATSQAACGFSISKARQPLSRGWL